MSSHPSNATRPLPVLARPGHRSMRANGRPFASRPEGAPRTARAPSVLTLSRRRIARRSLPDATVPYLRMSGRWLEEHGFAIGSAVQVVVEHGRVTIISTSD